MYPHSHTN